MSLVKSLSLSASLMMTLSLSALASVTVSSPTNGEQVSSPFKLNANAGSCSSQSVSAMGYSMDNSSDTTTVNSTSIDTNVAAGTGNHTIHVKAWGDKGASCVTDVDVTVTSGGGSGGGGGVYIPGDATKVSSIQVLGGWKASNDSGAAGSSNGSMAVVGSPSQSGSARRFITNYSDSGNERYQVWFGDDESATNFVYDGWVYLNSSVKDLGNLEMDMNQVMSNGQTVIFGFQCDGWNGTWDYTKNSGTPEHPKDTWVKTSQSCNPRSWSLNTWHHVQISYSRTDTGVVTYNSVWLDGKEQVINVTTPSAFALGWSPALLTNFQVDGYGSGGQTTIYLDNLTIYRW